MDPRTQERVERWDSRPFDGGRDELISLAEREFSGAIHAGGTWLFMLNGRVVGVVDGSIEETFDAAGTVYTAPDPALPLLCAMEERGGETRASYYTNETPLSEVDRTLQDGGFTGYIELSEQVLSGDYYVVYYGGRRMAAAYIGTAERLLTGDEAFDRADDEVGIYEVTTVDVEVTDIPGAGGPAKKEPASSEPANDSDGQTPATEASNAADSDSPAPDQTAGDASATPTDGGATAGHGDGSHPQGGTPSDGITASDTDTDQPSPGITDSAAEAGGSPEGAAEADSVVTDAVDETEPTQTASIIEESEPSGGLDPDVVEAAAQELEASDVPWANGSSDEEPSDETPSDERFKEEERWRETRQIPSIDPDATASGSGETATNRPQTSASTSGPRTAGNTTEPSTRSDQRAGSTASADQHASSRSQETTNSDDLKRRLSELKGQRDALQAKYEALEAERDQLQAENSELAETVTRLERRIDELESQVGADASGGANTGGTNLSPQQALAGTNVFVRYDTKSDATLDDAHAGEADREAVGANLRLERHTEFDATDTVVAGAPYDEFVESTMEYRFVEWLITTVLHEVRDTGHADKLSELYDVIPRIDRVELSGAISLEDDDTEDVPDEVRFDVVAFDKRGSPLVVANTAESRDPASRSLLERLEENASAVGANYPDLGAAFAITSSYFEPGALEVTEAATSGGFLSRGSKLSFVSLSRKQGYHLCLVEARDRDFHLTVPEL